MATPDMPMPSKLWEHPDPQNTKMARFMREANSKHNKNMKVSDAISEILQQINTSASLLAPAVADSTRRFRNYTIGALAASERTSGAMPGTSSISSTKARPIK